LCVCVRGGGAAPSMLPLHFSVFIWPLFLNVPLDKISLCLEYKN
jgi:hypothetical protein